MKLYLTSDVDLCKIALEHARIPQGGIDTATTLTLQASTILEWLRANCASNTAEPTTPASTSTGD